MSSMSSMSSMTSTTSEKDDQEWEQVQMDTMDTTDENISQIKTTTTGTSGTSAITSAASAVGAERMTDMDVDVKNAEKKMANLNMNDSNESKDAKKIKESNGLGESKDSKDSKDSKELPKNIVIPLNKEYGTVQRQLYSTDLNIHLRLFMHDTASFNLGRLEALMQIRKLSIDGPYDNQMLQTENFVQVLLNHVKCTNEKFQIEALWILTNLNSRPDGKIADVFITAGLIPILFDLLDRGSNNVKHEVVWTLANIASDHDLKYRDMLLKGGLIEKIITQFQDLFIGQEKRVQKLETFAWLLKVLVEGRDMDPKYIKQAMPMAMRLMHVNNHEVLSKSCYLLACATERNEYPELTNLLLEELKVGRNISVRMLIGWLMDPNPEVCRPFLRLISNLIYASDDIAKVFVEHEHGIIPILITLVNDTRYHLIRSNAVWSLANIAAVDDDLFAKVFTAGALEIMERRVRDISETDHIKRTVFYFFSDIPDRCNPTQLIHLINCHLNVPKLADEFVERNRLAIENLKQQTQDDATHSQIVSMETNIESAINVGNNMVAAIKKHKDNLHSAFKSSSNKNMATFHFILKFI